MICNDLLGKGEKLGNSIGLECTQGNVKQIKHIFDWIIMTPIPMQLPIFAKKQRNTVNINVFM